MIQLEVDSYANYIFITIIIRICIKIGSRRERRRAAAHRALCSAREEYLHSFQFDPTSNMLKLPPPHQLPTNLSTNVQLSFSL